MKSTLIATSQTLLRALLIAQSVLMNVPVFAQENGAATFGQRRKMLEEATLTYAADRSALIRTPEQFEAAYLEFFNSADHAEIYKAIRPLKMMPRLHRSGSKLVATQGVHKFELEWPDSSKPEFKINGMMFSYNPEKNLVPQVEEFIKHGGTKTHASFWFHAMLPEANAIVCAGICEGILIGIVAGMVVAALSGPLSEVTTVGFCKIGGNYLGTKTCLELRAKRQALARTFKFDAVKNLTGTDKKNILGKFEGADWKCPTENDGKVREYRGRIRPTEMKDGKQVPSGDGAWIDVLIKLNPDGNATDFIFVSGADESIDKIDTKSTEGAKHLVAHVIDDPSPDSVPIYRVPDTSQNLTPAARLSKGASPTKNLTRLQKASADEEKQMNNTDDMIGFLNYRNYKCVEQKAVDDLAKGVDPGSPVEPKKETPATK